MNITPEALCELISKAIRRGARAPELRDHVPELVDALCPPTAALTASERSMRAEQTIKNAINTLDIKLAGYLSDLLALAPGTYRLPLGRRKVLAGKHFGIGERAAYDNRHKALEHLANALYLRLG